MRISCFLALFIFFTYEIVLFSVFFRSVLVFVGSVAITAFLAWWLSGPLTNAFNRWVLPRVNVEGKAVLITGCDYGLGHVTALTLNKCGFTVFAGCLSADSSAAKSLLEKCMSPDRMILLQMDVTNDHEIDECLQTITRYNEQGTSFWGLVNNAGLVAIGRTEWGLFESHFQKLIEVNLFGPIKVTRKFLPLLRQSRGRIVNICSTGSWFATGILSSYGMSKAAMAYWSDSLRIELRKFGVQPVTLFLAAHKTNVGQVKEEFIAATWTNTSEQVKKAYGEDQFKRLLGNLLIAEPFIPVSPPEDAAQAIKESLTFRFPLAKRFVGTAVEKPFWVIPSKIPSEFMDLIGNLF